MSAEKLSEPPFANLEIGPSSSCVVYDSNKFRLLFNRSAWFEFRTNLWLMATALTCGEDISVSSSEYCDAPRMATVIPYCEITLIEGDVSPGRFLRAKKNYLYRPEYGRVDFSIVRREAEEAFVASEKMENDNRKIKIVDNLSAEVLDNL